VWKHAVQDDRPRFTTDPGVPARPGRPPLHSFNCWRRVGPEKHPNFGVEKGRFPHDARPDRPAFVRNGYDADASEPSFGPYA
jgi:hypothetical protein